MIEADDQVIEKRVNYFFKNTLPVHLKFKKGYWLRGYILEVGADYFELNEFMKGQIPVFFAELESIDQFKEKRE